MNYFSVQWINTGGLKRKQKKQSLDYLKAQI